MNSNGAANASNNDLMPKIARDIEAQIAHARASLQTQAQGGHYPSYQHTVQPVEPAPVSITPQVFEQQCEAICKGVFRMLVEKNRAYGNSVFEPVRVFSKASVDEQLNVRLDDKLSRVQKGHKFADENELIDIIGYLVIKLIALQQTGLPK